MSSLRTMIRIDTADPGDWPAIRRIFEEGIATGNATFTSVPPETYEEWMKGKVASCALVVGIGADVIGWAAVSRISDREVYSGVVQSNMYVESRHRGRGIGSLLLASLISRTESEGIWTVEAWIFPENEASVSLHMKHGFRIVGTREKIGRMGHGARAGRWRDVLLLERRSTSVGVS